jgi:hypothetical protein
MENPSKCLAGHVAQHRKEIISVQLLLKNLKGKELHGKNGRRILEQIVNKFQGRVLHSMAQNRIQ